MRRFFDKHMIVLTLLPVLAVMVMIFCFSSQNGEESGRTSAQVTEVVVHVTHPDYEQLPLAEKETIFARTMHAVRKSAHFSEFALLGFFLLGHFKALSIKLSLRYPALFSALAGMLYAASDEFHQGFVGGRAPALLDVGIDSAGALCGIAVMALLLWLFRAREGKKG